MARISLNFLSSVSPAAAEAYLPQGPQPQSFLTSHMCLLTSVGGSAGAASDGFKPEFSQSNYLMRYCELKPAHSDAEGSRQENSINLVLTSAVENCSPHISISAHSSGAG